MSILVDNGTVALIQGITGRAGTSVARMMKSYGTKVAAGVTPGKGGENVEGIPVYDTVTEAIKAFPDINTALVYVPAPGAKDAALEAIGAGIPLVHVFTEKVAVADAAKMLAAARAKGCRLIGPSSVGIISPGKAKIGSIGGMELDRVFQAGNIGVISKSGGMSSEVCWLMKQAGLGQSTVVGIGGDIIVGSDFADLLAEFEKDDETKVVVMFGEIGGVYEEKAAQMMREGRFTKPVVAFVSGRFAESLGDVRLGHAGAIIEGRKGTRAVKLQALKDAGALIAELPDDIPRLLKQVM